MTKFWSQNFHSIYVPSELRVSKNLLGSFIAKIVTSQKFGALILLFRNPLREYFLTWSLGRNKSCLRRAFGQADSIGTLCFNFYRVTKKKKKKQFGLLKKVRKFSFHLWNSIYSTLSLFRNPLWKICLTLVPWEVPTLSQRRFSDTRIRLAPSFNSA